MSGGLEVIVHEAAAVEAAGTASGRAGELLLIADRMVVTAETAASAVEYLKGVKQLGKQIDEERRALTDPLNATVKRIIEKFKPAVLALERAEAVIKGKIAAHQAELERERREAESKALEAQRREEARLEKLVAAAAARGDVEKAERFAERAAAVSLQPVQAPPAAPPEGIVMRDTWRAEVTDLRALVSAVAAGTVPAEAVVPNEKYLGQVARSLKSGMTWPGVRVTCSKTVAAGR